MKIPMLWLVSYIKRVFQPVRLTINDMKEITHLVFGTCAAIFVFVALVSISTITFFLTMRWIIEPIGNLIFH